MLLRRILLANVYHCVLQTPIAALASVTFRLVAVQALAGAPCLGIRMRNRRGAASLAPMVLVVLSRVTDARVRSCRQLILLRLGEERWFVEPFLFAHVVVLYRLQTASVALLVAGV